MSIVTKEGDGGVTDLYNGERVPKDHPRIEAIGQIDTLNSMIGNFYSGRPKTRLFDYDNILIIMHWLFDLGAYIATPRNYCTTKEQIACTKFDPKKADILDRWIHIMYHNLPKQTGFILPIGKTEWISQAFVIRSKVREVERAIISAIKHNRIEKETVIPFINRLSDYFFALGRYLNHIHDHKDIYYQKNILTQYRKYQYHHKK